MELFTRDVYHIINVALLERNYYSLSIDEKRKNVTECFNNYFAYKISQLHLDEIDEEKCITPVDYIRAIEPLVDEDRMEKLSHPVHCLLGLISSLQSFEIIWEIDDSLEKPVITSDNILRRFITSKSVSMVDAFGILYDYFMKSPNLIPESERYSLKKS